MTLLVRNRNGGVHVAGCSYQGRTAQPWLWAEGRDPEEWAHLYWLHACTFCRSYSVARKKWGDPILVTQDEFDLIGELGGAA